MQIHSFDLLMLLLIGSHHAATRSNRRSLTREDMARDIEEAHNLVTDLIAGRRVARVPGMG